MDLLGKILSGAAGFVGKKTKALASGVGNTAGLAKDLYDYNTAKDPRKKQEELVSYNNRFNAVNEAMKQFGFDSNKQGNQFDPVQYAKGITGGAGEVTSIISPMGGGMKARAAVNALPGFTNAISEGKGIGGIATDTALSSVLGMGGEGMVKGGGKLLQKLGGKTIDTAENLGMRRFGLTKQDVNKLNEKMEMPVQEFLKKNNLIGKSADDLGDSIRPLQQSFDDIANNSNLQLNKKEIAQKFKGKIKEFSQANAPELQRKGAALKEYFGNLNKSMAKGVDASKITAERKTIDSLVKDFANSGDAVNASTNRVIRDLLQDTVREGADKVGLKGVGGKSLQELGNDLSKFYQFQDVASKRAPQPTGLPAGLLKSIYGSGGAGIGAAMGGLPGAAIGGAAGMIGETIMNSPKFIQMAAQKGVPLGKSMIEKGGKLAENQILQKAMGAIGRRGGVAVGDALSGTPISPNSDNKDNQENAYASPNIQSSNNNLQQPIVPQDMERQQASQIAEMADPNMEIELVGPDGQPTGQKVKYSELQGQLSQGQMQGGQQAMQDDPYMQTQAKIENAMTQALQAGDIKAFTEFAGINENLMNILEKKQKLQPQGEDIDTKLKQLEYQTKMRDFNSPSGGKSKALPQTAVQELSDFDNSVGLLDNLSKVLESKKGKMGPLMGRISSSNVYDNDAQSVQSELNIAAQVIGKALEGGKLAEGDIARYRTMLPNLKDTPEVAQYKIETLKQKIKNQKGARLQSYNQAGFSNSGELNQSDMLAQILAAGQI